MESLWRVETHAHTAPVSPCGRLAPEQLVEQVRAAGYDALFVTDHYTPEFFAVHPTGEDYRIYLERSFSGSRRAAEAGRKAGLRVFPGLEVRLYDGPEDYPPPPLPRGPGGRPDTLGVLEAMLGEEGGDGY